MESLTAVATGVAVLATILATAFELLPDRIDLTFVFAAYGAGNVVGTTIAVRRGLDPVLMGLRWGVALMCLAAAGLALGLTGLLPS